MGTDWKDFDLKKTSDSRLQTRLASQSPLTMTGINRHVSMDYQKIYLDLNEPEPNKYEFHGAINTYH